MIDILNKLSEEELEKFGLHINSRSNNSYSTIVRLYNYLHPKYPGIRKEDITPEKISLIVYKEENINIIKVRKLLTDFRNILDRFLVRLKQEEDDYQKDLVLLGIYNNKDLKNRYRILLKKFRKKINKLYVTDFNLYYYMFKTEEENFNHYHTNNDSRVASAHELKSRSLSYFFVAMQLNNYYDNIVSEIYVTKDFKVEYHFYENVMAYVEKNIKLIKLHHPYIYMLYLIVRFYENYEMKYLKTIEDYFERSKKKLTGNMIYDFYEVILSAYLKIRSKKRGNVKEANKFLFELCDNLYIKKDPETIKKIRKGRKYFLSFVTIVNLAITLNKRDWLKEFIFKYDRILTSGANDDSYNLGYMKYFYFIGEYEKAIASGSQVSGKFPNYYYLSKIMIIRSYFELGDFISMHTVFSNLRKYLTRNKKLNDFDYNNLKNFLTTFGKFIRIVENSANEKIRKRNLEEFRMEIVNMKVKPDSYLWFLAKSG
ncbi:MAG TPA: hypothetical protein PKA90_13740 [Ignavibacteria bacterium]|nr:hypothetical protein [Ignavibacteria bacterium]HMR41481.1 hypothetical protein [Ignavibacteria bacterium]